MNVSLKACTAMVLKEKILEVKTYLACLGLVDISGPETRFSPTLLLLLMKEYKNDAQELLN